MSKAIEEDELTVTIKRLQFILKNLYVQTKVMMRKKRTYPLSSPTPVTDFLINERLLSL